MSGSDRLSEVLGVVGITGAAGFIGRRLFNYLLEQNCTVFGCDLNTDSCITKVDVREPKEIESWLGKCRPKTLFHLAAITGVRDSHNRSGSFVQSDLFRTNVVGTQNAFLAASSYGVKKFLFTSSSSVYSPNAAPPWHEQTARAPISDYGLSKLKAESFLSQAVSRANISVAIVRLFTVYGGMERPDMLLPQVVNSVVDGRTLRLFGDGRMARDFTFVADVIDGIILASTSDSNLLTLNIARGESRLVEEVVEIAESLAARGIVLIKEQENSADHRSTSADIVRARSLGFSPKFSLEDGIAEMLSMHRDRKCATINSGAAG